MKILLVGPGIMPIPNDGWGAVEIVVWQQKIHLEQLGHKVKILNKRGLKAALLAMPWRYDVVHLHYDELAPFWNKLAAQLHLPLIITTHYGYAAIPESWDDYYKDIFAELMKAPALLVLSPEIADVFRDRGYPGWLNVLPNGVEVNEIAYSKKGNGKAICLGKIEPRKRQADLAKLIDSSTDVACDFVGPLVDESFKPNGKQTHYLGTWVRKQVHKNLTSYSCLILASDGEAHPLVVLEAQAAGLSVVVTKQAAGNLDPSKPWVHVIDSLGSKSLATIREAIKSNAGQRTAIRNYAKEVLDWSKIAQKYVQLMQSYKEVVE